MWKDGCILARLDAVDANKMNSLDKRLMVAFASAFFLYRFHQL